MKKKSLELVFILDKSGSMYELRRDVVGGFNSLLEQYKETKKDQEVYLSMVVFNTKVDVVRDRVKIDEIQPLTLDDFFPDGCTALYDAVGGAIKHFQRVYRYIRPSDVPEKTIFFIMTDGMENASKKYRLKEVAQLIEDTKERGWEYVFSGANIDVDAVAESMHIEEDRRYRWESTGESVGRMMCEMQKITQDIEDED